MRKMIDMKNFIAVVVVLTSIFCMISGFMHPLHIRIAVGHSHFNTWLCMSSRDGGRGETPYSNRGGGRPSSGGRGRGRGRATDLRENSVGAAESQKDIIYDSTNEVEVTRLFTPEDRCPLSSLTDGQKLRGRIVSVKEFGMFVDVGAKRDGLVHVKDISRNYFINNHQSKFIPGQDVDVWVKFVESKTSKLSLQMFQPDVDKADGGLLETDSRSSSGSGFGAAIKRGRDKGKGEEQESDELEEENDDDEEGDNEDEEDDEDDDGEGEELDAEDIRSLISGRSKQPSISVEEYKGKAGRTGTGYTGGNVDYPGSISTLLKAQSDAMKVAYADKSKNWGVGDTGGVRDRLWDGDGVLDSSESEEISMDEVFKLLCGGEDYVTKERLLEWDYLQEIMQDGELTRKSFDEMFKQAGSMGRLSESEFDDFFDLLIDHLGLEEALESSEDSSDDVTQNSVKKDKNDKKKNSSDSKDHDKVRKDSSSGSGSSSISGSSSGNGGGLDDDVDGQNGKEDEEDFGLGSTSIIRPAAGSIFSTVSGLPSSFIIFEFEKLSKGKKLLSLTDFFKWVYIQNLMVQGSLIPDDIPALFAKFSVEGKMNLAGLQAILMHLSVTPLRTSTTTEKNLKTSNIRDKKISNTEDNSVIDSLNFFIEPDEQFNEEMSVEKSFAELSGKRKIVTYESLVGWDIVAELLQDGALNKEDLKELCMQAGGKKKVFAGGDTVHLTFSNFEELLDLLAPLAKGDDGNEADDELLANQQRSSSMSIEPDAESVSEPLKPLNGLTTLGSEEEDEQELLSSVFRSLSGQKNYVAAKDLLDWDIVLELMGEGLLTDDLLKEIVAECAGFNGKGVTLAGFDQLVDKLVELYGNIEEEGSDESSGDDNSTSDGGVVSSKGKATDRANGDQSDGDGSNDDSDDEEEDQGEEEEDDEEEEEDESFIEIDTEEVFEHIAKGKSYATFEDLKSWEFLVRMMSADELSEDQLIEIVDAAGVTDRDRMDILAFEAVLDELTRVINEEGEEEDGEEDE